MLDIAREQGHRTFLEPFSPDESMVWHAVRDAVSRSQFEGVEKLAMEWLVEGRTDRLTALFAHLGTRPDLPLAVLFDDGVRRFMQRVGDAWERGDLPVSEEHLATQCLLEALFRMRGGDNGTEPAKALSPGERLVAVVGAMEGNEHHLGSLCIRLLLERLGHDVVYLGPNVPVEEFATAQRARKADLVCISVMPPGTPADMARCIRVLQNFYRADSPFALLLGGSTVDASGAGIVMGGGHPFRDLEIFGSSGAFVRWMESESGGIGLGGRQ